MAGAVRRLGPLLLLGCSAIPPERDARRLDEASLPAERDARRLDEASLRRPHFERYNASLVSKIHNEVGVRLSLRVANVDSLATCQHGVALAGSAAAADDVSAATPRAVALADADADADAAKTGSSILFVHMHKSAGSSMCALAQSNAEATSATNCNLCGDTCGPEAYQDGDLARCAGHDRGFAAAMGFPPRDPSWWLRYSKPCAQRQVTCMACSNVHPVHVRTCASTGPMHACTACTQAEGGAYSFMALERWTDDDWCEGGGGGGGLLTGTILRDPIDRIVSNTKYARAGQSRDVGGWNASSEEVVRLVAPGKYGCADPADPRGGSWVACVEDPGWSTGTWCDAVEHAPHAHAP